MSNTATPTAPGRSSRAARIPARLAGLWSGGQRAQGLDGLDDRAVDHHGLGETVASMHDPVAHPNYLGRVADRRWITPLSESLNDRSHPLPVVADLRLCFELLITQGVEVSGPFPTDPFDDAAREEVVCRPPVQLVLDRRAAAVNDQYRHLVPLRVLRGAATLGGLSGRQRVEDLRKGRFGESPHLLVGALLDRMPGEHPPGVHPQGPTLGVGRLREAVRGHEDARQAQVFQIDYVMHTARRAGASVGQGFDHRPAFGGDLAAQIERRRLGKGGLAVVSHCHPPSRSAVRPASG